MKYFHRYVAIGDSTSEGLDDPDGRGGYRGWANRLAERIAAQQGSLLYANLAVRGRTTRQILDEQLAPALAMHPDLATVVAGTNDVLRSKFNVNAFQRDLEGMQTPLVDQGATVLTFTLPDLSTVMPLPRVVIDRVMRVNEAIREACANSGALLFDLARYAVSGDPRFWADDRLHANAAGHARIADGLAWTLGVLEDDSWATPLPPMKAKPSRTDALRADVVWVRNHLLPWVWRHMRGRSSGDGVTEKRPALTPLHRAPSASPDRV